MTASLTTGEQAQQLISRQLTRLEALHPDVLQGDDPEDLHQFRVSLRRLRSLLSQFEPALILPPRLNRRRIAVLTRATGNCRDADVLRECMEQRLLPRLEPDERRSAIPLLHRLKRQRRRAIKELRAELNCRSARDLFSRLDRWCCQPQYSSLGQRALAEWLPEWLQACSGRCFLHGGWFAAHPADVELHELRKNIKGVRYGLEALRGWLGEPGEQWISDLRNVQTCLGNLHDQQMLMDLLRHWKPAGDMKAGTALPRLLEAQRQETWQQWLQINGALLQPARRRSLLRLADSEVRVQEELRLHP